MAVALALPAGAQFSADALMAPYVHTNATGSLFPYRAHIPAYPEAGRKYPLILFLHGSGECGTDNQRQIRVGLPTLLTALLKRPGHVLVVAPQCEGTNRWTQLLARGETYRMEPQPTSAMEAALAICRRMVAEHQADPDRLYVTGLSLGGFGAWEAVQREPSLFAAAVPICGGGDMSRARELRDLPIWVFHGTDDKNVSVECSRRMVAALRGAGNRTVSYTEYERATHNVWDRAYATPALLDWLLLQTRERKSWWMIW